MGGSRRFVVQSASGSAGCPAEAGREEGGFTPGTVAGGSIDMLLGALPMVGPMEILVLLAAALLFVWPMCRICSRAGFPAALGLLSVVPLLNVVLLFVLAFAEWPAFRNAKIKTDGLD